MKIAELIPIHNNGHQNSIGKGPEVIMGNEHEE